MLAATDWIAPAVDVLDGRRCARVTGSDVAPSFDGEVFGSGCPDDVPLDVLSAVGSGEVVAHFEWSAAVGCGFPGVVQHGVVHTAANLATSWPGEDARTLLEEATGCTVVLANDADAAGLAEMRFGAGRGRRGTVLVVTLGMATALAQFVRSYYVKEESGSAEIAISNNNGIPR